MTCAGRSRSRSLALPISARTRRTSSIGNVLAITPRLMWSLRRTPAGRPAGTRAIAVAHPRASASMAQPHLYVNGIGSSPGKDPLPVPHDVTLIATMAAGLPFAFAGGLAAVRMRLPPIIGYILAGIVVGPFTPG